MLKINLLPEHFALARKTKQLLALFAVLLVIVAVVWVGYSLKLSAARVAEQARIDEFRPKAAAVDTLESETGAIKRQVPTFARRVVVVRQLEKLPERYIEEFDKVKRYIFANVRVLSWSIDGGEIRIDAEADTAMDVGRFYLNINRCPYITNIGFSAWSGGGGRGGGFGGGGDDDDEDEDDEDSGPSFGGPGGSGGGMGGAGAIAGGKIPIQVSATLVNPIRMPTPGAGAAPAGPARPAAPPTSVAPPPGGVGAPGATGMMPSAAAPGGGVVMPEEM